MTRHVLSFVKCIWIVGIIRSLFAIVVLAFMINLVFLKHFKGAQLAQLVECHKVASSNLTRGAVLCPSARHFIFIA